MTQTRQTRDFSRIVTLTRHVRQPKGTLGRINYDEFAGKTLELPWLNNAPKISCIPIGDYPTIWSFSPHFKRFTYEVTGVKGRAGIRIHAANFTRQLLGCIAIGDEFKDLDSDGSTDILHSGATLSKFETLMLRKSFNLRVVDDLSIDNNVKVIT